MQKRFNLVFFIGLLSVFTLIFGCENGPTIVSFSDPVIYAELRRCKYSGGTIRNVGDVLVYDSELVPIVSINGDTLNLQHHSEGLDYRGRSSFYDYVSLGPGDECELIVYHSEGEASATVSMPGDFELTSPQENDSLFLDEDFAVSWTTSENADRYYLRMSMRYSYIDTAGNWGVFSLDSFLYTTDTSFIVPFERILPLDVDSIGRYGGGYGYVAVDSENGAWIGHSLEGNITGDGVGYFTAYNQINEGVEFRIGGFSLASVPLYEIKKISPRERFEERLEYLISNDPNFMQFEPN